MKGNDNMKSKFKVGQRVHFVNQNGADHGEMTGTIIRMYPAYKDCSEDKTQYDVENEKGDFEMAYSQELTLVEKISPRSSFTAELMLEDAIEAFGKHGVIDAERVVRALTEIKEELKEEFDHQYELELIKRGRR